MEEQFQLQKLLRTRFERLRAQNPSYSRRAFSKRLGVSAGAMSELFSGRRRVSRKIAERIALRLALDPQERSELLTPFQKPSARLARLASQDMPDDPKYLQLSTDQFQAIADWQHFAILSLMRTPDFQSDAAWIARRLGLRPNLVEASIERLLRLGLVRRKKNGRLERTPEAYRTSDDIANASVRLAHSQYLTKAREALDTLAVDARDFTSVMFPLNKENLPEAKEMIRKFQDELTEKFELKPCQEVYQFCTQLFPLTKKIENGDV